nr:DUF6088 family protein [Nitrosovibrio sp. Nv17]
MNTLPETILQQAQSLSEGSVLSPKEFLHLGSRSAVDQAFSRLAKAGTLLRIARGTYAAPVSNQFGSRAPRTRESRQGTSRSERRNRRTARRQCSQCPGPDAAGPHPRGLPDFRTHP